MRINFFFESKIFFADKKILIQDKKITPHFRLSLISAPMALNQKHVFDSCSRSEHRPARARTAAAGRKISFSWAYYTHAHVFHENDTARRLRQQGAQRNFLQVCLGRARALPSRGRGTRWRRYRVTRRRECSGKKKKNSPDPLQGHGENFFFYFEGVLLIICSVSYSKALTCFTDLGMVYHFARPALRTVLTSSWPPSGRCSIAIQER